MTYGLQLFNAQGRLALSTEYKHYRFVKKVSITAFNIWYDLAKTNYTDAVLVAFVCADYSRCSFSKLQFSIGHGKPPPAGAGLYIYSDTAATAYIFDLPTTPPQSGYGMAVYNSAAELIFDTDARYLQVLDTFRANELPYGNVPFISPNGADVIKNYPNVMKVAVIPVSPLFHVVLSDSYDNGVAEEIEEWSGRSWFATTANTFMVRMEYINAYLAGRMGFAGRTVKAGTAYCIIVDISTYD